VTVREADTPLPAPGPLTLTLLERVCGAKAAIAAESGK
jgi:hypothetical protein